MKNLNNYQSNSKNNLVNISEDKTNKIDYINNNEVKDEIFNEKFIEKIKKKNCEYYCVMLIKKFHFKKEKNICQK